MEIRRDVELRMIAHSNGQPRTWTGNCAGYPTHKHSLHMDRHLCDGSMHLAWYPTVLEW